MTKPKKKTAVGPICTRLDCAKPRAPGRMLCIKHWRAHTRPSLVASALRKAGKSASLGAGYGMDAQRPCPIAGCPHMCRPDCRLCERHADAMHIGMVAQRNLPDEALRKIRSGRSDMAFTAPPPPPPPDRFDAARRAGIRANLAGHALNGLLSAHEVQNSGELCEETAWYAHVAVKLADAIEARLDESKGG